MEADQCLDLGLRLHEAGRLEEALCHYRKAAQLNPTHARTWHCLGIAARESGHTSEAVECLQRAVALSGSEPACLCDLGVALRVCERFDQAEQAYRLALRRDPGSATAWFNLGNLLKQVGRVAECIACYRQAERLAPGEPDVITNLGVALQEEGQHDEALRCYELALTRRPDYPEAHWNRANWMLLHGRYAEGWAEYRWRWKVKSLVQLPSLPDFPIWSGQPLGGRSILLVAEQGLGDTIQFVRYARQLSERGARASLLCAPPLRRLLSATPGIAQVFAHGDDLPAHDYQVMLLDLPRLFQTRLESIPTPTGYLLMPEAGPLPAMAAHEGKVKVGLVWAGSPLHTNDRNRSIPLGDLVSLFQLPQVQWFSFQVGARAADLGQLPEAIRPLDLSPQLHDFADTAAALQAMDLVVSADTSVAHLAGAMGRPTWVLLPQWPDWRWLLGRSDSPWYSKVRLFRQRQRGQWSSVVAEVDQALRDQVRAACSVTSASSVPQRPVLYFAGQPGAGYGWGVCNANLLKELSQRVAVVPIDETMGLWRRQDLPGRLFNPVADFELEPFAPARGSANYGYTFFENALNAKSVENARRYDLIFAGSTWCQARLAEVGIRHTRCLIQGVDTTCFRPQGPRSDDGRFVLFSGGKFEFRKGQDLVLAAFRRLQDRYPALHLVTAWYNFWPASMDTMRHSPHILYARSQEDWRTTMDRVLERNGVRRERVTVLGRASQAEIARAYHQTDLGLFPNRCEGGTNLVLMEYMACGKPTVVAHSTGHLDITDERNAILLRDLKPCQLRSPSRAIEAAGWTEPTVDDLADAIEWAMAHRSQLQAVGDAAARTMRSFTWSRTALHLLAGMGLSTPDRVEMETPEGVE